MEPPACQLSRAAESGVVAYAGNELKGYGNLVQLAALQHRVATDLDRPVGRLSFIVKSAHIYDTEFEFMRGLLAGAR